MYKEPIFLFLISIIYYNNSTNALPSRQQTDQKPNTNEIRVSTPNTPLRGGWDRN